MSGERSVAAGPAKRMTDMDADAIRVGGGLEGSRLLQAAGSPPHKLKARTAASDGQRIFTRAARSARLNFAVRSWYKSVDIGRDHLIHRKRSPFPYEGKALTRLKLRRDLHCRTRDFTLREGERVCRSPHPPRSGPPSPQGEGQGARKFGRGCP